MPGRTPGRIITFYTPTHSTGNSMAVANVAWILASSGKKVLVLDFHLNSPSLQRYFYPLLVDKDTDAQSGVNNFLVTLAQEASELTLKGLRPGKDCDGPNLNIVRWAASLDWEFPGGGALDFIPAGHQHGGDARKLDWDNFYKNLGGGLLLECALDRMRKEYHFIIIDSQSGFGDIPSICAVHLPDYLAVCFTLHTQSIDGAMRAARSAAEAPRDGRGRKGGVRVFPVPMRVDFFEKNRLDRRREFVRSQFSRFLRHIPPDEHEAYWGAVEIPYFPFYSYEEVLAPFSDMPKQTYSLLWSAERVAYYLSDKKVKGLVAEPPEVRREVLRWYSQVEQTKATPEEVVKQKPWLEETCRQVRQKFERWEVAQRSSDQFAKKPAIREAEEPLLDARLIKALKDEPALTDAFLNEIDFRKFWVESLRRAG